MAQDATQLVMGHGNPSADLVFVGEAPGKNEDLSGIPFVGTSGKLLDEMLETVGINRSDVYITNIVKYRPPNNRDPLPEEKKAFWPFLLRELKIIQPKVVVTLGRHSMEYFIPEVSISDAHGKIFEVNLEGSTVAVLVSYHPAAAIYNRSLRNTLFEDFKQVNKLINFMSIGGNPGSSQMDPSTSSGQSLDKLEIKENAFNARQQ